MYAVLMKQMLYLKMLAWLEDNIYCNPAIDDLALYMGYSRRFVYDVFYQYGQLPIGQYIRLRRLTIAAVGNDSNLLIVFYVQIVPDDFVMQLHRF